MTKQLKKIKPVKAWATMCSDGGITRAYVDKDTCKEFIKLQDSYGYECTHKLVQVLITPLNQTKTKK